MTDDQLKDREDRALLEFLDAQRGAVLAIVEGLDEEAWHRPVVPSGWTPAGLVEHLGTAEPQVAVETLPDVSHHMLPFTAPEKLNALLTEFFRADA